MVQTADASAHARPQRTGIVDTDVHPMPTSVDEIRAYMAEPWKSRYKGGGRGFFGNPAHGARLDAVTPSGGAPGTDPDFMRAHHLDFYGVDYAVLLPRAFCNLQPDPDFGNAIAEPMSGSGCRLQKARGSRTAYSIP